MLTIDFNNLDIYQVIRANFDDERIQQVLATLPDEEREVLIDRAGINQDKLTRNAIAEKRGVTLEVVRGIESRALKHLKHPARVQMINSVLDPNFKISEKAQEYFNQFNNQANKKM